jgi:hypothetical protein
MRAAGGVGSYPWNRLPPPLPARMSSPADHRRALLGPTVRRVRRFVPRRSGGRAAPRAAVVCVGLSLLLWLALTLRQRHVQAFEARTEVVSLPPGEGLVAPVPATVRVLVEGTGFRLLPLFNDPPRLTISAGQPEVNLEQQLATLPPDVRLLGVTPRVLRLRTEPLETRRVPVALRALFSFATSYGFSGPVQVSPESVEVTGARPIVENLRAWPTAAPKYVSVRETLRVTVPLSDTLAGIVTRPAASVRVVAPVAAFTGAEREIEVRVVGPRDAAGSIVVSPASVRVRYRVLLGQYEAAQESARFFATVQYEALARNASGVLRPTVHLPPGFTIRDVQLVPETVTYYRVVGRGR